jgi:arylsulfatase A-like enzyme
VCVVDVSGAADWLPHRLQPFFFAVGFHKPHPNWPIPRYLQDKYKDLPLSTAKFAPKGMPREAFISCDFLQDHDDVKAAVLDGHGILPNSSLPDVLARKIRAGYAAGITWMDSQAGRVLDQLDAVGKKDDTIVLFTADHVRASSQESPWSAIYVRVRVEIMGSQKCGFVGKSQPVLMMINLIIFTRTRMYSAHGVAARGGGMQGWGLGEHGICEQRRACSLVQLRDTHDIFSGREIAHTTHWRPRTCRVQVL